MSGATHRRAWLTPDAPEGTVDITLTVPQGIAWEAIVRGCLVLLLYPENYEQFGDYTPEQTADEFAPYIGDLLENWPSP